MLQGIAAEKIIDLGPWLIVGTIVGLLLAAVLPQLGEVYTGINMRLQDAAWVGHRLAELLPLDQSVQQHLLEIDDPEARLRLLAPLIEAQA